MLSTRLLLPVQFYYIAVTYMSTQTFPPPVYNCFLELRGATFLTSGVLGFMSFGIYLQGIISTIICTLIWIVKQCPKIFPNQPFLAHLIARHPQLLMVACWIIKKCLPQLWQQIETKIFYIFNGFNYTFWSSFSHLEPAVASMPPLLENLHSLANIFLP